MCSSDLGTVDGVTEFDAALGALVPTAFVAVTVNVYDVPLTSPVTVIGLADPVANIPPGIEVTVYVTIAEPPSLAGGVNVTVACVFPAVAVPITGAPGIVEAVVKLSSLP